MCLVDDINNLHVTNFIVLIVMQRHWTLFLNDIQVTNYSVLELNNMVGLVP